MQYASYKRKTEKEREKENTIQCTRNHNNILDYRMRTASGERIICFYYTQYELSFDFVNYDSLLLSSKYYKIKSLIE